MNGSSISVCSGRVLPYWSATQKAERVLPPVSGVVVDSILSFYERRMRALLGPLALVTLPQLSQQGTNTAGEGEATLGATVNVARATHRPRTRRRKRWPTS